MSTIVMKNNLEGDGPILPPVHEDGSSFAYCMYFSGDAQVVFADTQDELLETLIPGYGQMSEDDKDVARIMLASAAAAQVQAEILMDVDPDSVSPADWDVLVARRDISQPRADWWTCDIPLVVVETGYQPYTDVPRPASSKSSTKDAENLWFVRPVEEEDFLVSLHEIGYIRMLENRVSED